MWTIIRQAPGARQAARRVFKKPGGKGVGSSGSPSQCPTKTNAPQPQRSVPTRFTITFFLISRSTSTEGSCSCLRENHSSPNWVINSRVSAQVPPTGSSWVATSTSLHHHQSVRHRLRASRSPAVTVRLSLARLSLARSHLVRRRFRRWDHGSSTSTRRGTGDGARGPHDSRLFSNPRYNEISP